MNHRSQTGHKLDTVSFEYPTFKIGECSMKLPGLSPLAEAVKDAAGSNKHKLRKIGVKAAIKQSLLQLPDGRSCKVSPSFVTTFLQEAKCGPGVFNLMLPEEVFNRLAQRRANSKATPDFRFALEKIKQPDGSELVTARSMRPTDRFSPDFDLVREVVDGISDPVDVIYSDGKIDFTARNQFANNVQIVDGDGDWQPRTFMSLPVDNFGRAFSYVEMLRLLCTNGAVAISKGFRSEINLGSISKDKELTAAARRERALYTLRTYIETVNDDEGSLAMADRLRMAARSHLSLREYLLFFCMLGRALGHDCDGPSMLSGMAKNIAAGVPHLTDEAAKQSYKHDYELLRSFNAIAHTGNKTNTVEVGDGSLWRVLLSEAGISAKKAATIPTSCSVYQAINTVTEAVSHHLTPSNQSQRRRLHGLVGTVLSNPSGFDCEGSYDTLPEGGLSALINEANKDSVKARQLTHV